MLAIGLAVQKARVRVPKCASSLCNPLDLQTFSKFSLLLLSYLTCIGSAALLLAPVVQNKEEVSDGRLNKHNKDARETKHQATEKVDDFKHQAEKAKHEVAKVVPESVKEAADKIAEKAHEAKVQPCCSSVRH